MAIFTIPLLISIILLSLIVSFVIKIIDKIIIFILNRAIRDIEFRNNVSSCLYFMMDLGPSVSSISIIAIVLDDGTSVNSLLLLFFLGIFLKFLGRKVKNHFYKTIMRKDGYVDYRK